MTRITRWAAVIGVGLVIALIPRPAGISAASWNLLAIFVGHGARAHRSSRSPAEPWCCSA